MRTAILITAASLLTASVAYAEPTQEECMNAASPAVYKALGCHERGKKKAAPPAEAKPTTPAEAKPTAKKEPKKTDREIIEGLVRDVDRLDRELASARRQLKTLRSNVSYAGGQTCRGKNAGAFAATAFLLPALGGALAGAISDSPGYVFAGLGAGILPGGLVGAGVEKCSTWLNVTGATMSLVSTIALIAISSNQ